MWLQGWGERPEQGTQFPQVPQEVLPPWAPEAPVVCLGGWPGEDATQARQESVEQSPVRVLGEALNWGSWGTALWEGQRAATEGGCTALGSDRGAVGLWGLGLLFQHPPL